MSVRSRGDRCCWHLVLLCRALLKHRPVAADGTTRMALAGVVTESKPGAQRRVLDILPFVARELTAETPLNTTATAPNAQKHVVMTRAI